MPAKIMLPAMTAPAPTILAASQPASNDVIALL
jgi:hypothetical protein